MRAVQTRSLKCTASLLALEGWVSPHHLGCKSLAKQGQCSPPVTIGGASMGPLGWCLVPKCWEVLATLGGLNKLEGR